MKITPLSVLRIAAPGAPKLRELARRMHCSATAISQVELGQGSPSPAFLKAYAKAVRVPFAQVERRFLLAALAYHDARCKTIRTELRKRGIRPVPGRQLSLAG